MKLAGSLFLVVFVAFFAGDSSAEGGECVCSDGGHNVTGLNAPGTITDQSCGALVAPENGNLNLKISSDEDGQWEVANFNCHVGYNLVGPSSIACRNGSWIGKEPVCQPVQCGIPESVNKGRVHYLKTTFGSKAVYACDPCYKLLGVFERSCKKSGRWSKRAPFCVPDECVLPELGPGLYRKRGPGDQHQENPRCETWFEVGCYYGYRQSGARKGKCIAGGFIVWYGSQPTCTKW